MSAPVSSVQSRTLHVVRGPHRHAPPRRSRSAAPRRDQTGPAGATGREALRGLQVAPSVSADTARRPDLRRRSVRRGVGAYARPMRAKRSVRSHNAVSTLVRRGGDRKPADCRCAAANLIPSAEPTCRRSFGPQASGCRPCTGRKAAGSSRWGRSCRRGEDRTAPPAPRPPEGTRP